MKDLSLLLKIEPQEIDELLHCLCATYACYAKGDHILEKGTLIYDFGIMLSGHGRAIKWDSSHSFTINTSSFLPQQDISNGFATDIHFVYLFSPPQPT